jgi:hypothetical protein
MISLCYTREIYNNKTLYVFKILKITSNQLNNSYFYKAYYINNFEPL